MRWYIVFSDVETNPNDTSVTKAAALAEKENIDIIAAIGGGSPIDTAKAAGVLVTNGGFIHHYFGLNKVTCRPLPLITIPTTSGTGSEVTSWAVITDTRGKIHTKESLGSMLICANVALVDPMLTLGLPPRLTAYTGIDALTHAIEGYFSLLAEPVTDALCISAIRLISGNLAQAVLRGNSIESREKMMLGSLIAGMGFTNSDCALVHCIGEAIGSICNQHHGLLMGIFLPYVMEYNLDSRPTHFARIARAMGENIDGLPILAAARKSIEAVVKLSREIGMPVLRDINIKTDDFPQVASLAMNNVSRLSNPRTASAPDITKILADAFADKFSIAPAGGTFHPPA